MQSGKKDPKLYNSERDEYGKKNLNYYSTYVEKFLQEDPLQDGDSFERCKELGYFFVNYIKPLKMQGRVLDAGTKDGQFPQGLEDCGFEALGIEIDDRYVSYAQEKDRPVIKDDITNISCQDEFYNVVFSHHVLGLCPDYQKAYDEMLRVCKRDGFVITCNSVPGNPKKHYSLVNSAHEVLDMLHFIHSNIYKHEVVYFDYGKKGTGKREDELVVILKRG